MRSIISLRSNITRRKANITESHFLTEYAQKECFLDDRYSLPSPPQLPH